MPDPREGWLARLGDPEAHRSAMLHPLFTMSHSAHMRPSRSAAAGVVAAWNIERGRRLSPICDVLQGLDPEVALLTELDLGMARSGNVDVAAEIAERLGWSSVFAVEYVELGLGTPAERESLPPASANDVGLHGNAIFTTGELRGAEVIRIESDGAWFGEQRGEPRVGGRMALAAQVKISVGDLVACVVHLESESDPRLRADQLEVVLDAIDSRYGSGPAVVAGDLNTFSASLDETSRPGGHASLHAADPSRWHWPVPYEPLFEVAARYGYSWDQANEAQPSLRLAAGQDPAGIPRLDWLLVRGLDARSPRTVPAVVAGNVISDHDLIVAEISGSPPL